MRHRVLALIVVCLMLSPGLARAVEPDEVMADPVLEARARDISAGLRCLVCQNQSIDDSHATLARDLRLLVRERLKDGDTDQQVRDYLVARYGDFVLLRPPVETDTLLLWGLPFIVLAVGAMGLALARRRSATVAPPLSLTSAEQADIERIVGSAPP